MHKDTNIIYYNSIYDLIKTNLEANQRYGLITYRKPIDEDVASIISKISIGDTEDTLLLKIYDVLFFNYGGSHLKESELKHLNKEDYRLLATKISLKLSPNTEQVDSYLNEIISLQEQENDLANQKMVLYYKREALINKLQDECRHPECVEISNSREDEYGTDHYTNTTRTCLTCGLKEEGKDTNPWIDQRYNRDVVFMVMTGKVLDHYTFGKSGKKIRIQSYNTIKPKGR